MKTGKGRIDALSEMVLEVMDESSTGPEDFERNRRILTELIRAIQRSVLTCLQRGIPVVPEEGEE